METIVIVLSVLAFVLVWVAIGEVLWLIHRRRRRGRRGGVEWWGKR